MVLRLKDGRLVAIDGRETAPRKAESKLYMANGKVAPERSRTGPLAVGTPGALAAYTYAAKKFGSLPLKDLILPSAKIAENGFSVDATFAKRLASERESILRFAAKNILVDDVRLVRQKYGFNASLLSLTSIRDIKEFLQKNKTLISEYFDIDLLIKKYLSKKNINNATFSKFLFNVICIKMFLEVHS